MTGYVFHLIPHTHWDREWYLPRAAFQARFVAAVDDLLDRLRADPGFRTFLLDGQTVLVADYLTARPDREAELRALATAGRLQLGPWYVLTDELIPSGESLVHNLLLGGADAERWGGRLEVLYSPDAFGHPAVAPALAREFGIRAAVVWRGLGGPAARPRDRFRWTAPDGRDVAVWHLPPQGYEIGVDLATAGDALPQAWARVRDALLARAAGHQVPVFLGADHHAPPADVGTLRDRLAALEPRSAVRVSRLDEFFQAAEAEFAPAPPIRGELRHAGSHAWALQGVHGTRAPLKRRHARAELWLERLAEPLAALAWRAGGADRRPVLALAWRSLVRCQFHDTIAGCTSDVVARAAAVRLEGVEAQAREVARGALHDLAGHDPDAARERRAAARPALVLWNPAARARGGVVVVDTTWFRRDVLVGPPPPGAEPGAAPPGAGYRPFSLVAAGGQALPVQPLGRRLTQERLDAARHYPDQDDVDQVRIAFRAPPVPGLGCARLEPGPPDTAGATARGARADAAVARGRTLANRAVEVRVESTGALMLRDRRTGARMRRLLTLEGQLDAGDTYTFCSARGDRLVRVRGPARVRRLAAGPLVAALEVSYALATGRAPAGHGRGRGTVGVRLVVLLHADSPLVRCVATVDNAAEHHRLRFRLPTGLAGVPAVAGAAFGRETRPAVVRGPESRPLETPTATAPAHRFVTVARGAGGLALFGTGFFEYELTAAGDILLTLLRAVGELSRGDLPTRPGHAGWPMPTPEAQCAGSDRVELALAPVTAEIVASGHALPEMWEDAFLPVRGYWLRDALPADVAPGGIMLEGAGLVFSGAKPAQVGNALTLRCYNATDRRVSGAWRFSAPVRSAHRVRADERESQGLVLEHRGRSVRFVAGPREIVTVLVS